MTTSVDWIPQGPKCWKPEEGVRCASLDCGRLNELSLLACGHHFICKWCLRNGNTAHPCRSQS